MTTTQIPLNILADLCENVPGFAERVTVRKVYRGENIARQSTARKGLVIPFAQILAGPSARDLGDFTDRHAQACRWLAFRTNARGVAEGFFEVRLAQT